MIARTQDYALKLRVRPQMRAKSHELSSVKPRFSSHHRATGAGAGEGYHSDMETQPVEVLALEKD